MWEQKRSTERKSNLHGLRVDIVMAVVLSFFSVLMVSHQTFEERLSSLLPCEISVLDISLP